MTPRAWRSPIALAISLLALACAGQAWAQATSGSISGRVTDPSGAGLPGVTVTVTSERTGLVRESTTSADGRYIVVNLPPDTYALTAVIDGFKGVRRSGLTLRVDERLGIDVALEIGSFTDVVTVEGRAPLLQTQSAATGEVIEQRQIQDLPLLGRNFLELTRLTAGTTCRTGRQHPRSVGQRTARVRQLRHGRRHRGHRQPQQRHRRAPQHRCGAGVQGRDLGVRAGVRPGRRRRDRHPDAIGSEPSSTAARRNSTGPPATAARPFFATRAAGPQAAQLRRDTGRTASAATARSSSAAYEGVRLKNRFAYLDSVPPRDQIRVLPERRRRSLGSASTRTPAG